MPSDPTKSRRETVVTEANVLKFAEAYLLNGRNGAKTIRELFPDRTFNETHQYRVVNRFKAHRVFKRVISEADARTDLAISHAIDRYGITQDRLAEELARIALSELRDVVQLETIPDPQDGKRRIQRLRVRDFNAISPDAHKTLAKVTQRADGSIQVELHDKLTALRDLARLKGWIADRPAETTQAVSFVVHRSSPQS